MERQVTSVDQEWTAFVASLKDEQCGAGLSPARLAEALDLPLDRLAAVVRVHRATITHAPDTPRVQEAMGDILRVLGAAHSLSGSLDATLFWFRNQPIAGLRHLTPMRLLEQGKTEGLVSYVASIRGGAAG